MQAPKGLIATYNSMHEDGYYETAILMLLMVFVKMERYSFNYWRKLERLQVIM